MSYKDERWFRDGECDELCSGDSPERAKARQFIRDILWEKPGNKPRLDRENLMVDDLLSQFTTRRN